jgi:putative uncharacterized protein (fragment)
MSYHILSKELSNPELKGILQALNAFFQSKKIDFYIVGATARDILLTNLYGLIPERKTMDIDIAISKLNPTQVLRILTSMYKEWT